MQISKLKKEITDELTTMESHFGDMDITELSLVDRADRLDINYKTESPIEPRKAALDSIKDKKSWSLRSTSSSNAATTRSWNRSTMTWQST